MNAETERLQAAAPVTSATPTNPAPSFPDGSPALLESVPELASTIYMLRTTQQHHVQLSAMADQKANIVIGASLLVVTLLVGQASANGLSAPMWVMGIGACLACFCGIFAVMPRTYCPKPGETGYNLLFFGGFSQLSEAEYIRDMSRIMGSSQSVYEALLKDIYGQGQVLANKKYRWLRRSYQVFLGTLLLTLTTALLAWLPWREWLAT